jgi:hypothetical protein
MGNPASTDRIGAPAPNPVADEVVVDERRDILLIEDVDQFLRCRQPSL